MVEYSKLGSTIVIGVQWEPIVTTVPTPAATTVSSFVVTTDSASVATMTVPMTATTTVPMTSARPSTTVPTPCATTIISGDDNSIISQTSPESWEDDEFFASTPNSQWTLDDDVLECHNTVDNISLATTSAALCEEQGTVNPTDGDNTGAGESSDFTAGEKEPSNLNRSFFEEILTERKRAKSDGKHISMAYKFLNKLTNAVH